MALGQLVVRHRDREHPLRRLLVLVDELLQELVIAASTGSTLRRSAHCQAPLQQPPDALRGCNFAAE
eukprot:8517173-Lingulodinium_polyedra.AAC.1